MNDGKNHDFDYQIKIGGHTFAWGSDEFWMNWAYESYIRDTQDPENTLHGKPVVFFDHGHPTMMHRGDN